MVTEQAPRSSISKGSGFFQRTFLRRNRRIDDPPVQGPTGFGEDRTLRSPLSPTHTIHELPTNHEVRKASIASSYGYNMNSIPEIPYGQRSELPTSEIMQTAQPLAAIPLSPNSFCMPYPETSGSIFNNDEIQRSYIYDLPLSESSRVIQHPGVEFNARNCHSQNQLFSHEGLNNQEDTFGSPPQYQPLGISEFSRPRFISSTSGVCSNVLTSGEVPIYSSTSIPYTMPSTESSRKSSTSQPQITRKKRANEVASLSSDAPLKCPDCNVTFGGKPKDRRGRLSRHRRSTHEGNVFQCHALGCPKVFSRSDCLLTHERRHPELKRDPPKQRKRGLTS
ncbi:hypothetical protein M501DRAFT_1060299 [Patellaria atrata CBS 101060]|uniref:C2H2-type domain-containing protein n=1 Tax=Patellaria atrata CBS 101060 TaxID=1346257 RepID=A0A9P4S6P6_9PEZI|nr:hypothetical protein M501DRAFT_1060299 [Patellaria atrata CBS 101060]